MEVTATGDLGATALVHVERRRAKGDAIDCAITQGPRMAVKTVQSSDKTARQRSVHRQKRNVQVTIKK